MKVSEYEKLSPAEAVSCQQELRKKINLCPLAGDIKSIAGADISFNKYSPAVYAVIVTLSYPELGFMDQVGAISISHFPYIPGLLAFREIPALMQCWDLLPQKPDILILDGQGIAHPRRMGIATHFGILAGIPTIGVAKSKLFGRYEEPAMEAGSFSGLHYGKEQLGWVYRSKKNCRPVFISPGNRLSLEQSIEIVKNCMGKYRLPEPTRQAHLRVNDLRVKYSGNYVQTRLPFRNQIGKV